jgi:hypothetical protein
MCEVVRVSPNAPNRAFRSGHIRKKAYCERSILGDVQVKFYEHSHPHRMYSHHSLVLHKVQIIGMYRRVENFRGPVWSHLLAVHLRHSGRETSPLSR